MPQHLAQTSYNGGELSRRLQSRSDISIYAIGATEILNAVPTIEGALVKRPGTRWRFAAAETALWLTPFIFNATQAYLIEWSDQVLRLVTNNELVPDGPDPLEIEVPYSAAEASAVSTQQSGDVLYMAHGSHPHAALSRTGAFDFSYDPLDLAGGPFADRNRDESITVYTSAATGSITVHASAPIFAAGHVGSRFRMEAEDFAAVPAWELDRGGITIGTKRRSEGRVYRAASGGRTGSVQPLHTRGSAWDGDANGQDINAKGPYGVLWEYLHDRFGIVKITGFTSSTEVTATVERRLPDSLVATPSHRWAHGLFSAVAGWPHLVCLYRGRLWLFKGLELAGSVSGSYRDFSEYNDDGEPTEDMAIRRRLDIPDKPVWVRADRQSMVIGTALGEFAIGPINPAEPISSENIQVLPQGSLGSAQAFPIKAATETIFLQRGGRKIRAAAYDFGQDRYIAPNLTLWARQMTVGGVRQLAHQAEPEELLWALRNDGTAVAHPYNPQQDIKGWSHALAMEGASVLSLCSIPSPDGTRDDLWLLVERGDARSLEQLTDWWDEDAGLDPSDGCFMDSAIIHDGAAIDTIELPHLAGEEIMVLGDGAELPLQTVPGDGTLILQRSYERITAGKAFTARLVTLRPEPPQRDGASQGRIKRIVSLVAALIDSFGVRAGSIGDRLDRLVNRSHTAPMDSGPSLFSGWTDGASVGGGNDQDGRAVFEDRSPFPWILTGHKKKLEIGDR